MARRPASCSGCGVNLDAFRPQPELTGPNVILRQLDGSHLDDVLKTVRDPEVRRLTGTHARFTEPLLARWLESRPEQDGRADWAVTHREDGRFLGDLALNDIDADNESAAFRIALAPGAVGRGYGTEATRLVLEFAFETVGLHRVSLEVYDFNSRARRAYEKCGFVAEGVLRDALCWEGKRHHAVVMSVLAPQWRLR
ncbi:GNAT family N-acetyltransferase [Amycolatopsis acidiphila]|uniref:GNAT family N-acetyltransferase n=1 Tax=Amycolatopsis acidiphila TaxID=715473 RepID=UPI001E5C3813|nr:GNAT family protein [Amycolatopsis acidiphila]UIJ58063.1 GNAT family N-acetyltransferase [Amycolatopsis acidiphila]